MMVTFLEYFKGNSILNPRMQNGKNIHKDPGTRKHANSIRKEYKHKHPIVDSISSGRANNVSIKGEPLNALLQTYQTNFQPGSKTLGNSNVEVEMYEDEEGVRCGILKRKNHGM